MSFLRFYRNRVLVLFVVFIYSAQEDIDFYADSYALLIGINNYQFEKQLNYAVADAKEMKRLLTEKLDFPDGNIEILLDDAATLQGIKRSMQELASKTSGNDRVLIYFAGHGKTQSLPSGGEEGYLIPVNGKSSDLFLTSLAMNEMKRLSEMTPAKDMLFLMDACYSGLMGIGGRSLDLDDSSPNLLKKIAAGGSRTVITAGKKGEIVQERSEWGHSAFVKSLISGLEKGMADLNGDEYITDRELGDYLAYQVTRDTNEKQTPSISKFTTDQGQFVFILGDIDLHFKKDGKNDLDEIREEMKQLKADLKELNERNQLLLDQNLQMEPAQEIEQLEPKLDSNEDGGIVYKGDKLGALEEEMEELEKEMRELTGEMGLLTEEMIALQDEINEAENIEEGKEGVMKHLKSEMDRVGGEMGRLGGEMGRLGGEMGRVGGKIEKLKKQKQDSVNELLEKLKDLGIESEEISKISDNIPFINNSEEEERLLGNAAFSKSPTWHYENNEASPVWLRYNRSEGLYLQYNNTFQSEIIPGSSFYGGIGRAFHRNIYQWIVGYEQLVFNNIFQFYFETFDKSITPDAWRVWDGENSLAAFLLKKDYLDWYRGQGFRTAGFIHIKNYISIGSEYNQIDQSLMNTVLDGEKFKQEAYRIQKGDNNYLKSIITLGFPIDIGIRRKLQFYSSFSRMQSVGNTDSPYINDHFFLNILAPYTNELNFNIKLMAGASDVAEIIWKDAGYHQNVFEIGGKGTLRGYDWKEFSSSHYFLSTLEIWFDEFGVLYDRAVIFESPGNTFNSDYLNDLNNNLSNDIHHSAGISLGDEDASLSFVRKLNGDKTTIIYFTLTLGAPLQYW